ncbi:hypothetical protein UFOVP1296_83 [uncultured Caudovirales phage]|uniref:Uncharacterized protein n=1 Tax=uncultured Caudovirales phage TaxID=2100421 RepID=A0A6J5PQ35_9CAUD|nr:hypothetical protein UFOVP471_10 [uncultured Caudovirales phage]CAB4169674.1 hypothetical protein UFOVP890_83 [uncultured Caudovirales phage]CAB4196382.1 hypothetical protein UFOVP1296_83 [uncultured Caudovirales phage]
MHTFILTVMVDETLEEMTPADVEEFIFMRINQGNFLEVLTLTPVQEIPV